MNTEEMDNSTVNFTTPETSTNSTTQSIGLLESLNICMFSINLLFGLPTHSYVIRLIVTGTGSGVASEFFILNLCVCEIGNCLNSLFYIVAISLSSNEVLPMFLLGLIFSGRPLFQCLMCVERYLAVVHPITFLKYKPLRYRVICCSVIWIITLGSCFLCLYTSQIQTQFLSVEFLLFLSIQLFCLGTVLRALKQSGPGERRKEREDENLMKRRAFLIILINTVTMIIIYVPFAFAGLVTILTNRHIDAAWFTGLICYVLAGFVQPVLYLHRAGKLSCF